MGKVELLDQPNKCEYCGKKFMNERTLFTHMCEQKRRALQRDEKRVQAGFMTFNRFFELTQKNKKPKTYDEFCNSPYYNAFVKFGSFVNNVNPIYPEKFVDYVIKSGVRLDHWCRDALYEKYLYEMIKVEPVENAIQRTLTTMIEWGEKNNAPMNHYFLYASLNKAVHDIRNGMISPWLILNSQSGKKMVESMSDDQLEMISPAFDVPFWLKKFKEVPADVVLVKEVCKEIGIT